MRRQPSDLSLELDINCVTSPSRWGEIITECWVVTALAECEQERVEIASAVFYRLDNRHTFDPVIELAEVSYDLSVIAEAVFLQDNSQLEDYIWPGSNFTLLVADRVAVDPLWRGRRLGPALVHWTADALRADGVFLTPAAVQTRRTKAGEVYLDYDRPRGDAEAKAKVVGAWRRAGFRKLNDHVMWHYVDPYSDRPKALKTLERFERDLQSSEGLAWFRRQVRRAATPS